MTRKKKILFDLKANLTDRFGDVIEGVILYGSRAENSAHRYSDWDFLVIVKHAFDWTLKHQIIRSAYDINLKYDIITDIKVVSRDELSSSMGRLPYIANALTRGLSA